MIRTYRHDDCTIAVEAPAEDQDWLEAFLAPAFSVVRETPDAVRVTFSPDVETDSETAQAAEMDATCVAFALDSAPLRLPCRTTDTGLELDDQAGEVRFHVSGDGRTADVRYRGDRRHGRVRLMRVVREYAHNHALVTGGVMLHGAAFAREGRAVVIAGDKGTGKTTLLFRLLEAGGLALVSNDRVLVRPSANPVATAIPTIIAWRPGSRALLPGVAGRLTNCGDYRDWSLPNPTEGPVAVWQDSWYVGPAQVSRALDCVALPFAPLDVVVVLEHAREAGQAEPERTGRPIRRLGIDEAADALARVVLCHHSGIYGSAIFRDPAAILPDAAEMARRCRALAPAITCFSMAAHLDMPIEELLSAVSQE